MAILGLKKRKTAFRQLKIQFNDLMEKWMEVVHENNYLKTKIKEMQTLETIDSGQYEIPNGIKIMGESTDPDMLAFFDHHKNPYDSPHAHGTTIEEAIINLLSETFMNTKYVSKYADELSAIDVSKSSPTVQFCLNNIKALIRALNARKLEMEETK